MHRFKTIAHLLKRLPKSLFERFVELLIDRFPHLF
jgi:hypothetical protein